MFLHVDRDSHTPAYIQIEEAIRGLILQGAVRAGSRLPSSRELSRNLGVNRITINKAFRRLEASGLISSEVGRGTYVRRLEQATAPAREDGHGDEASLLQFWGPLFANPKPAPRGLPAPAPRRGGRSISFVYAAPPPDLFPADDFRRCVDFVLKRRVGDVCRLGPADGLGSLKEYLVQWLAQNGITATERNLVITTGCQQSLDLIRKVLVHPGDRLLLENPTYPGAVGALSPSGAGLLELPVQEHGPDMRMLSALGGASRPKLVYVSPNFQNPTGVTMPLAARRQLVEMAGQSGVPIVEDDVFGDLRYDGPALPSLHSLCPGLVIYIGSFSKALSPGLRLGWVVAPQPAAEQLAMAKQASDLHTGMLLQVSMDEFCRRGLLLRNVKRMRRAFRNRRDAMAEALARWFPTEARWKLPEGGLSIWVTLPGEWDTAELLADAQERGVQFLPGAIFYFRSTANNSMRLSFASENEQAIRQGVRLLGEVIERRRPRLMHLGDWQQNRARAIV